MKSSKNAFTMIELVFVIVILGILAAVAIPKLAATRNDARISTMAQNIMCGASEIATYAMTRGSTDDDFAKMSSAMNGLSNEGSAVLTAKKATIKMGNVNDCVVVEVVSDATDDNLTVSFGAPGGDPDCLTLQSLIDARKYPMTLRGNHVVY